MKAIDGQCNGLTQKEMNKTLYIELLGTNMSEMFAEQYGNELSPFDITMVFLNAISTNAHLYSSGHTEKDMDVFKHNVCCEIEKTKQLVKSFLAS